MQPAPTAAQGPSPPPQTTGVPSHSPVTSAASFVTFPMIMTYDSSHYMGYVEILEGKMPFTTWDIVRGPVFPILIFLSNFFFGKTAFGLVLFALIFYLIALFVSLEVLKIFNNGNKVMRYISLSIFTVLVIFNIIICFNFI